MRLVDGVSGLVMVMVISLLVLLLREITCNSGSGRMILGIVGRL